MDEEILQDFLVEAADLIEQLNEQLIQLESDHENRELLNAIFRGFHTVKGGAGFIGVTPLVEVCHRAENIFDKIRNQDLVYVATTADAILASFDAIQHYIDELNQGTREFVDADPELLNRLDAVMGGTALADEAGSEKIAETSSVVSDQPSLSFGDDVDMDGDITDDEFEALLNQRDQLSTETPITKTATLSLGEGVDMDGDITDDEFEALLNQRERLSSSTSPVTSTTPSEQSAMPSAAQVEKPSTASNTSSHPLGGDKAPVTKPSTESTVRVDTSRLDNIMNLVGELVLVRNRLLALKDRYEDEEINSAVGNLDHVTTDLQNSVMKTRMQPVKKVFGRFPRVVRDLARKLGKQIELTLEGEETDLDKNLVEALADPLVHLVRNSVDHGIEMPDVRHAAGKAVQGAVVLAARQEGDHILLSITDDGAGMDADVLKRKAIEKGILDELTAAQMEDKDAYELILAPGFSTKTEISDISGRGVGMDVVKNMITKLNGSIDIFSELGKGTQMEIRVPLTLAILPTLMVTVGDNNYALPLSSVQEIFDYDSSQVNVINGKSMVRLRQTSIRLYFLDTWLSPSTANEDYTTSKVIIVNIGGDIVGIVVDLVRGQEEVVIKPLGVMLNGISGYAGATITGDGKIALIIDLPSMVQRFMYLF